jgi:large subunit ribosomal protein LP0
MGKNTMIRKAIKGHLSEHPKLEKLLEHVRGNVGFVFTKDDLSDVRTKILENQVAVAARAGTMAPVDVKLPAQVTGLDPEKTSFFQALSIPTKITKGRIEILNEMHLIVKGERVGASEATLLGMLGVLPFSYGLVIKRIYDDGTTFGPEVLDITAEVLAEKFREGIQNIAAISLAVNYPNAASVPHMLTNGMKKLMAVSLATDIDMSIVGKPYDKGN